MTHKLASLDGTIPGGPLSLANWRSVCWSRTRSLFVAVGFDGTGADPIFATSPNGADWTFRTTPTGGETWVWRSVCWANALGLFVAVHMTNNTTGVATSPDGITWTLRNTPAAIYGWYSVAWSEDYGVLVAVSNTGKVMTSTDGTTWTERTAAAANSWVSVCWSPELGIFVAVSNTGTGDRSMYSTSGVTWFSGSTIDQAWTSVCWCRELSIFIAVGDSTTAMKSTDGVTWSSVTLPSNGIDAWKAVIWAGEYGLIIAVGRGDSSGRGMVISQDGSRWEFGQTSANGWLMGATWSPELGTAVAVPLLGGDALTELFPKWVPLAPDWGAEQSKRRIQSDHRTRAGRLYQYKWADYPTVKMSVSFVSSYTRVTVNSWWGGNSSVIFTQSGTGNPEAAISAAEPVIGKIVNDSQPISEWERPYLDLWRGTIELEGY